MPLCSQGQTRMRFLAYLNLPVAMLSQILNLVSFFQNPSITIFNPKAPTLPFSGPNSSLSLSLSHSPPSLSSLINARNGLLLQDPKRSHSCPSRPLRQSNELPFLELFILSPLSISSRFLRKPRFWVTLLLVCAEEASVASPMLVSF